MEKDDLCITGHMPNLGELLTAARERYGLNKKQMAEMFEFDESTYGRLENGKTQRMNSKEIGKLKEMAPYIGVPYSELLAAAGISSEMKKEVFYDFDGSEIDYVSAIKYIYKADPKLFMYLEGMSRLPIYKIRLIEKWISMLLDEEIETNLSKKLITSNVINNLELYGISDETKWKPATHKTETNYPSTNFQLVKSPRYKALMDVFGALRHAAGTPVVANTESRLYQCLNTDRYQEVYKDVFSISLKIDSNHFADIIMICHQPTNEDEIKYFTQKYMDVRIAHFKTFMSDVKSENVIDPYDWDVSHNGFDSFADLQKTFRRIQTLLFQLKLYGGGKITLSALGEEDEEIWGTILESQILENYIQGTSQVKGKENNIVERCSRM